MLPLSSSDVLIVTGVAVVIFSLYIPTLSPTIAGGDSGELVAEGCALGTAHPPGYPLFTMMVYVLKLLAGHVQMETAYIVNVSSAVLTSLAALCMGLVILRVQPIDNPELRPLRLGGALLGMCAFAFSPLIWQYAVTAEVFPLNTFFAALIVYLVVEYTLTKKWYIVYIGAIVSGLALSNQHTIVLYLFPLILWIFYVNREEILRRPIVLFYYGFAGLAGLSCYAYLPIASRIVDSPGGWGDVQSLSGFLHHFLRRDYGTFQLYSGANGNETEGMIERSMAYLSDLYREQGFYAGPVLAAIGIALWLHAGYRGTSAAEVSADANAIIEELTSHQSNSNKNAVKKPVVKSTAQSAPAKSKPSKPSALTGGLPMEIRLLPLVLLVTQLFYFVVFHSLSNLPLSNILLYGVHQRFWMQPNVVTFIFIGLGFNGILSAIASKAIRSKSFADKTPKMGVVLSVVSIVLAIGISVWQYRRHYWISDQHDNAHFQQYAKAILDPLPQGSVLFINYDMQWTAVRYVQKCLGFRSDIVAINLSMMSFAWFGKKHHLYPNITFPGSHYSRVKTAEGQRPFTMYNFLEANPNTNVYLTGKLSFVESLIDSQYSLVPFGLTTQFIRNDSPNRLLLAGPFQQSNTRYWETVSSHLLSLPDKAKYTEVTWEWTIGRDVTDKVADNAAHLLESAIKKGGSEADSFIVLVEAAYWFEVSVVLEAAFIESEIQLASGANVSRGSVYAAAVGDKPLPSSQRPFPSTMLKNAGLAHIHLVQSKGSGAADSLPLAPSHGLFRGLLGFDVEWPEGDKRWKLWSTNRFLRFWGLFLAHPDARQDPQYEMIKGLYEKASGKSIATSSSGGIRKN